MKIDHLQINDGDILCLPEDTTEEAKQEFMRWLANAVTELHPGKRIIITACGLEKLSDRDLAAAGLYRSVPQKTTH
jgi:DNA-directed RNA polymerase specialized sigma24 family protein